KKNKIVGNEIVGDGVVVKGVFQVQHFVRIGSGKRLSQILKRADLGGMKQLRHDLPDLIEATVQYRFALVQDRQIRVNHFIPHDRYGPDIGQDPDRYRDDEYDHVGQQQSQKYAVSLSLSRHFQSP